MQTRWPYILRQLNKVFLAGGEAFGEAKQDNSVILYGNNYIKCIDVNYEVFVMKHVFSLCCIQAISLEFQITLPLDKAKVMPLQLACGLNGTTIYIAHTSQHASLVYRNVFEREATDVFT